MVLRRGALPSVMKAVEGARISIREIRNEGMSESVVIANEGHADQPLTGWSLATLQGLRVYRFEDGLVLRPGGRVTVTSGEGVAHRPPAVYGWTDEPIWNNRGDVALIFDCDGEEVARFAYPASRASRLARLPRHRLVLDGTGAYRVEPIRREAKRDRPKPPRGGRNGA